MTATVITQRFNVRAYGIWINKNAEVLLADEKAFGKPLTKFPGGGLEFGEGLMDCLRREWTEETGLELQVIRHYYTTEFFQRSAFVPEEQILSVYYLVKCAEEPQVLTSPVEGISFRWLPLLELSRDVLTLPIDQEVAEQLRHDFSTLSLNPG